MKINLIGGINREQVEQMTKVVAGAGKLSRCPGTVTDGLDTCDSYEKNVAFMEKNKSDEKKQQPPVKRDTTPKLIEIPETITVGEFASKLGKPAAEAAE